MWDSVGEAHTTEEDHMSLVVETDNRSRVVIPGHTNQRFVMQENADGSILLQPARVVTEAQAEYDGNPELRELLARAAGSQTVRAARQRRTM
jgi:hypothetical protein